ncbi:PREDICTED: kinesin-like calmodulin-binding protein homolog [Nicotiana attenuata]|uniref:Kinesin-like calmodulin-binding protein n=1 Tax=Nicotiana attenuata TaxID=49451 RepID=A0A314LAW5_NICAT|nr:PREDICTED: kinesin-like calmodulin-binding protein homolog [Nicotiana attenuata]OIT37934.1 kinesin-like calmodulin-binding protein [Nicotiana attenuata]
MFVQLSYVQLQHDYILGNYPVGKDDAAQMSALQILVDIGYVDGPQSRKDWPSLLEYFLPRQIAVTRAKWEWELDIRFSLPKESCSKKLGRSSFYLIFH